MVMAEVEAVTAAATWVAVTWVAAGVAVT